MQQLVLVENTWQSVGKLSLRERQALRQVSLRAAVRDLVRTEAVFALREEQGGWSIRPRNVAGHVTVEGMDIVVRPKVGSIVTGGMLRDIGLSNLRSPVWSGTGPLREHFVAQFLDIADELAALGFPSNFQKFSEVGTRPRGKIAFGRYAGPSPNVQYSFGAFMLNSPANRYVAFAAQDVVQDGTLSGIYRARAERLLIQLSSVSRSIDEPAFPSGAADGLESAVLHTAWNVVHGLGADLEAGRFKASGFLIQMSRLFELWLCQVLAELADELGYKLSTQGSGGGRSLYLDAKRTLRLRPDFAFWDDGVCVMVGDCKYKVRDLSTPRDDLYQIASYISGANSVRGLIIYADSLPLDNLGLFDSRGPRVRSFGASLGGVVAGASLADIKVKVRNSVTESLELADTPSV